MLGRFEKTSSPSNASDFPFFLFVGIHPSMELYNIFRAEPMHVLSLGINTMLNERLAKMAGDQQRMTLVMNDSQGLLKSYGQFNKQVLNFLNILSNYAEASIQRESTHRMFKSTNGFIRDRAFHRKRFDWNHLDVTVVLLHSIDQVLPYLGAIVDIMCGNELSP